MAIEKEETKITVKAAQKQVTEIQKQAEQARKQLTEAKKDQVRGQIARTKRISRKAMGKAKMPDYFNPLKKFNSREAENEATKEAMDFLLGIRYEVDGKTAIGKKYHVDSFSAKITYVGGRRLVSERVKLAMEKANPNTNNWRIFVNAARFFSGEEHAGLVKDPKYIRNCLSSDNFVVRIVKDKRSKIKDLKKQTLERDEKRALSMSLRIREDKLRLGVEFPLRPAEARKLLENEVEYLAKMAADGIDSQEVKPYFPEKTRKYIQGIANMKEPETGE